MVADAHGGTYEALRTLGEAKAALAIYDLDTISWPTNGHEGCGMYFERQPTGSGIAGGMGGGELRPGPWIHVEFEKLGLADAIRDVLAGRRDPIA